MCGITGFVDRAKSQDREVLDKMVNTLKHRGPDDRGAKIYTNEYASIGFGQTRLSIIDISPLGHQPMEYKHLSIVFNGEIYNYAEIKEDLIKIGHNFISHSDTEVILHAFEEWKEACIHKFIGMFAFVIYDQKEECIYAFRDRAGEKPFFYYRKDKIFLFSSELKAFHEHPKFEKEIDIDSLYSFFDYGYVPSPYCIFKNAYKLDAGHYLRYNLVDNEFKITEYWNANTFYTKPKLKLGYEEAKAELHVLLKSAYNYRMVADKPVGVFLSGGYDSTSVAAIIQSERSHPLKTFTIGFEEGNNEALYAKEIAKYLGTDHNEYLCTVKECQDIIPDLPYYYDEPFADTSAIPTTLVSRFAKEQVSVALSADAGDEIFAGYTTYPKLDGWVSRLNKIPPNLRPLFQEIFKGFFNLTPDSVPALKHRFYGLSQGIGANEFELAIGLYHESLKLPFQYKDRFLRQKSEGLQTSFKVETGKFHDFIEILMAVDYRNYLQNEILVKVDRATMSVGLEGRGPMVDHRILEFAAQLPLNYKYDGQTTKRILKDIVHEYIPKKMMDRPKTGFSLPVVKWLQGDLSYLIDKHLNVESLKMSGLFNEQFVRKQVKLFEQDKFHYTPFIWKLLMFQMWYEKWMM